MLKNILNNRGQNTAEYALLIALVVAGIIAMQTYAQRALQARVRDASVFMTKGEAAQDPAITEMGQTVQYEPYYQKSAYTVNRESSENKRLDTGLVAQDTVSERTRDGQQQTLYGDFSGATVDKEKAMPEGL